MLGSHHRFWTFVGSLMLLGAAAPGCGGGTDGGNGGGTGSGGDDDDAGLVPGEDGSVRPSDGGAGHDAGDGASGAQLDGEAPPPGPDAGCSVNGCTVGVCMTDGVCDPTATDGEKDGAETDTDCGGALDADGTTNSSSDGAAACVDGKSCLVGHDCVSLVCAACDVPVAEQRRVSDQLPPGRDLHLPAAEGHRRREERQRDRPRLRRQAGSRRRGQRGLGPGRGRGQLVRARQGLRIRLRLLHRGVQRQPERRWPAGRLPGQRELRVPERLSDRHRQERRRDRRRLRWQGRREYRRCARLRGRQELPRRD